MYKLLKIRKSFVMGDEFLDAKTIRWVNIPYETLSILQAVGAVSTAIVRLIGVEGFAVQSSTLARAGIYTANGFLAYEQDHSYETLAEILGIEELTLIQWREDLLHILQQLPSNKPCDC